VKVIIEGNVTLTDNEDIADEETDDFDGAALKAKVGSSVVLTGTGTLTVNGACKHGIKVSGLDAEDVADGYGEASFVIDGKDLTINIMAEEDGINSGNDLTIRSGNITVRSGDDGIKADYILTIGEEGKDGPTLNVTANETIEGATINIYSGNITVNAEDDGINAANKDLEDYTYSLNIMGGTINITAGADGIDSNGNVNILGGLTTIVKSASNGGEGGLDYEGSCYIKEGCLVNPYGTTFDSGKGGMGGQGGMPGWGGSQGGQSPQWNGENGERPTPPDWNGQGSDTPQFPGWNGQGGGMPGWGGQRGGSDRPDGESGATPDLPDGEAPELPNGEMPGFPNGSIPEPPDGDILDEDGNKIERPDNDGKQPGWGGQKGENGQRGGEQPSEGNGEAPQDTDDTRNGTETKEELNFFQKLINFIVSLFKK
ncbi:MAG: carbohydrate-binding domain-containing protein, partial [Firmicutes bacterium]|nr:carbohydrate-binding domain-containing protein [Bacillota bacterium]